MAPALVSSVNNNWDSSTTIELVALTLTIPGALAALTTLWIVLTHRRKKQRQALAQRTTNAINATTTTAPYLSPHNSQAVSTSNHAALNWFQDHYNNLHGEVTAERQQWAEEMDL